MRNTPLQASALLPLAGVATMGLVVGCRAPLAGALARFSPVCVFHELTGYYCAGCGMTRATLALLHGDVATAFMMNPLMVLLLPVAAFCLAWGLGWQPRAGRALMQWISRPVLWGVLLPGYWLARNLPWAPFSWLAPGGLHAVF